MPLKAIHYINQFYAGIGGEDMADTGFSILNEIKGPALGLEQLWQGKMTISHVLCCGDNFINTDSNLPMVFEQIRELAEREKPDVFVAGPAFNAGRYGVACAKVCDFVRRELHIPSVTAMWPENPAVEMYVRDNYIVPSTETATGMRKTLPALAKLALKLAQGETIGAARKEGYIPTGHRYNEFHERSGAERVVELLVKKLRNEAYVTEVPLRNIERIPAAPAVKDLASTTVALFTTGGLVPVGNPDKIKQAFAVSFGVYPIGSMHALEKGVYESIHGGYDTTAASDDPHRLVPLDVLRDCEDEGLIKGIYPYFGATCGVGTNVASSKAMGVEWAKRLLESGVGAAILTST